MSWRAEGLAIWAFAVRSLVMGVRNIFFLFELLFWPVIGTLSIGLMTRFLHLSAADTSFVLIGTIALSTVQVCQLEVSYAVLYDVWSKSVKHQFVAPIGVRHMMLGSWLIGILRGLVVFVLLAALSRWAFGFDVLAGGVGALALFLAGCFLTALVIGIFVCVLILTFGNRAEASAWATVNLVLVLAGIYYPVSVLPQPIAGLATLVPLTHFLDAYRANFGFPVESGAPIATGLALSALYVGLTHWAFGAAVRRSRRVGQLLKMSG